MNLKERGITVGDLVIIFVLIISVFFINKFSDKDKNSSIDTLREKVTAKILINS